MPTILHWFRRDLRVRDNTALIAAAKQATPAGHVVGVFLFDPRWWQAAEQKLSPFQAAFWLASLDELRASLAARNIPLFFKTSTNPAADILALAKTLRAAAITFNKDYEPAQTATDTLLEQSASKQNISIRSFKDSVLFEDDELLTGQQTPYSVFTPYKNAYLKKLAATPFTLQGLPPRTSPPPPHASDPLPTPASLGYPAVPLHTPPGEKAAEKLLATFTQNTLPTYADTRDFPALPHGTSHLSAHLSAGTLSPRQTFTAVLTQKSKIKNQKSPDTFLSELIWRDFYRMILINFPHTTSLPFRQNYNRINWKNDPAHFRAWSTAATGIPIVDAAIRQLLSTGFMHNRLRMVTAMFLTKNLDTHWILGERFFKRTLVDYDQAANVGGWQWSASTGTDAAPYFRIMNPTLQSKRFDPDGAFIRHYLPILKKVPTEFIHTPHLMPPDVQRLAHCRLGTDYPLPIVDLQKSKADAIAKFKKAK